MFNQHLPASYIPTSRIHQQQPRPSGTEYRVKQAGKYPYIKDPHISAYRLPTTRYMPRTTFSATGVVYFCLHDCGPSRTLLAYTRNDSIIGRWCRVSCRVSLGECEDNACLFLFCIPGADVGFRYAGSVRARKVNPGDLTLVPCRDLICHVTGEDLPCRLGS